jgi:hypothetical protein
LNPFEILERFSYLAYNTEKRVPSPPNMPVVSDSDFFKSTLFISNNPALQVFIPTQQDGETGCVQTQ